VADVKQRVFRGSLHVRMEWMAHLSFASSTPGQFNEWISIVKCRRSGDKCDWPADCGPPCSLTSWPALSASMLAANSDSS